MKDKSYWIEQLGLIPHPEGGYYREVYRSEAVINSHTLPFKADSDRNYMTSIYFLLDEDNYSAFHRIKSDEMWYYHAGDTLVVHSISELGDYQRRLLGSNLAANEQLSFVVEAGDWFASEVENKTGFVLVSCAVSPGFDFNDFELADKDLLSEFPQHQALIKRLLVKN